MKFSCPKCDQHIEADEEMAGMETSCPTCSAPIKVPSVEPDELKGGPSATVAKNGNWRTGERVPRTGTYKCGYCGPDGMAESALKHVLKDMGIPYGEAKPGLGMMKPPQILLKEGRSFPSCPNCKINPLTGGDTTGWNFVSVKEETYGTGQHKRTGYVANQEVPVQKVPCRMCGKLVLNTTAQRLDGLCAPCKRSSDKRSWWRDLFGGKNVSANAKGTGVKIPAFTEIVVQRDTQENVVPAAPVVAGASASLPVEQPTPHSMPETGETSTQECCPKGHGPLKLWEGEPRCWTCGWIPPGGKSGASSFEVPVEVSVFRCSDRQCPCPGTESLVPGVTGFLFISPEVVQMRKDALTMKALNLKVQRLTGTMVIFDQGTIYPLLLCRTGAEQRRLNLDIAAADAKNWVDTGRVPLRVTPKRT